MSDARMIAITTLFFLVLLLPAVPAFSHIEKGTMPDSIAEMEYRILLEFKPEDNVTRSLLGMSLFRQNKLPEAEKEFRLILKSDPKNFDALDGLGLTLFKKKKYEEALQFLQLAIAVRPSDIMVHLHLGLTLGSNGKPEAAAKILTSGLDLLYSQAPSPNKEQQMVQFKNALVTLPKKPGVTPLNKEN
ncbi:MAG: tetratricopeptide repeat protein [Desulfobulbaceae bacterium]|nr:tetratricopeptide repeat protein [Desulfobulbaceae bacterium]